MLWKSTVCACEPPEPATQTSTHITVNRPTSGHIRERHLSGYLAPSLFVKHSNPCSLLLTHTHVCTHMHTHISHKHFAFLSRAALLYSMTFYGHVLYLSLLSVCASMCEDRRHSQESRTHFSTSAQIVYVHFFFFFWRRFCTGVLCLWRKSLHVYMLWKISRSCWLCTQRSDIKTLPCNSTLIFTAQKPTVRDKAVL